MKEVGDLVYADMIPSSKRSKGGSKIDKLEGKVAYIGPVKIKPGDYDDWIGIQLTGESAGQGKCDGSVQGVRYFMCDNKGLKILALSIDDSALVLLCALVTIDTASTLYGLKALKKVSNCTIYQHILYAIFTKITLPFILFRFLKCVIHLASSQPALRYNV